MITKAVDASQDPGINNNNYVDREHRHLKCVLAAIDHIGDDFLYAGSTEYFFYADSA